MNINKVQNIKHLRRIFSMCRPSNKNLNVPKFHALNEEERLFFAKYVYRTRNCDQSSWALDWTPFELGTPESRDDVWKALTEEETGEKCLNKNKTSRKKTIDSNSSLFDTLDTSWVDVSMTAVENIDAIYKEHKVIVHRDKVEEYLKKPSAVGKRVTKKSQEVIEFIQSKRLAWGDLQEVQAFVANSMNKQYGIKKTIAQNVPAEVLEFASKLLDKQYPHNKESLMKDFDSMIFLGIMGFTIGELSYHIKDHDTTVWQIDGVVPFNSYWDIEKAKATKVPEGKLGLAVLPDYAGFTRCLNKTDKNSVGIYLGETALNKKIISAYRTIVDHPDTAGFSFKEYLSTVVRSVQEHQDVLKEYFKNLQQYHVFRQSPQDLWEYNFSVIAIELFQLGIRIHPDTLRVLVDNTKYDFNFTSDRINEIAYEI